MKFNLPNGNRVEVFRTDTGLELVTSDESGNVFSTVRPSPAVASALLSELGWEDPC